ncbi:tetratricopeptide repeat protein [Azonexus sp.]|uniref:tetratricopeptide repeat protein n=1 Tax=Azonexus sp. TaxID=1872668 RepID=UPI0035B32B59
MSALPARLLCIACLLLSAAAVRAAPIDVEMREAAQRHRQGDTAAAVAIWQRWAGQGDADAAYNLGLVYQHGDGVPADPARALTWYRAAADKGDKPAQFQIGLMYQNGEGVAADPAEAHRWFTLHRRHHMHHAHTPQMVAWRQQALALIDDRDRREQLAAARRDGAVVVAELQRRAGLTPRPAQLALAAD